MIALTLAEIAEITHGRLTQAADPSARVTGFVEFDSRKITPGGLFVALPGERVDGHDFAHAAIEKGAVAVLAVRELDVPAVIVEAVDGTDRAVMDAVVEAMSALAEVVAKRLVAESGLKIIGVTGSAGKTSTKDLLAGIFSGAGTTIAPPGSFNNEIGHPYTVLRCDESTQYLIAEMSARGIGHIAHLATIAPPVIGVLLNVGSAHLGEFGSRGNIALAKGELVEALPGAEAGGVAVLNADDPFVAAMASRTAATVVTYSTTSPPAPGASYFASDIELDDVARASFLLHHPFGAPVPVKLLVFGAHQVSNAVAAAAAALEAGLAPDLVAERLSSHRAASANRMDVHTRADGTTIINDSYNANPESMRAGVAALAYTASAKPGARAIAVLGEMGELGGNAIAAHRALGEELGRFRVTHLVTVGDGELNEATSAGARSGGVHTTDVADTDEAARVVEAILHSRVDDPAHMGDVVLIKASNAAGLWRVAEALSNTRPGSAGA